MIVIVKNMNCEHCVATIQKALLRAGIIAKINLDKKSVEFKTESETLRGRTAILDAGYIIDNA